MSLPHTGSCSTCGAPGFWARDALLDGDNTSLERASRVRGVFYETGEIERFLRGMEEALGASLDGVVFSAQKKAVRLALSSTLRGFTGSLARAAAPALVYRRLAELAPDFGLGRVSMSGYGRGGPLEVGATNVWDVRLFAAGVAGAFEAVEGAECRVDTVKSGDAFRFTVKRSGGSAPGLPGGIVPPAGSLSGERTYPRCRECAAPVSFQVFEWDARLGEVRERDNGLRVVHQAAACFDHLLNAVEGELGEKTRGTAVRVQADYVRDSIASGTYRCGGGAGAGAGREYFDCLGLIRRRCMGNPLDFKYGDKGLRVSIRNPANEELLVGRVLGTYEAVSGRKGVASGSASAGMLRVEVSSI